MKILIAIILVQIAVLKAQAILQPDWDRPLAKAEQVEVLEASGWLSNVERVDLTLTRNDNTKVLKLLLKMEGQTIAFAIQSEGKDNCNTDVHTASQYEGSFENELVVKFEDHANRFCKDLKEFEWDVTLTVVDQEAGKILGRLVLGANPRSVFTIQSLNPNTEKEKKYVVNDIDSDLTIYRIYK
ncbi:MAG: hypothetical protein H6625_11235 [Bdellovibrionaceae bacterium]|nr:hypothetical protein [Pseudobdellovibrionaceae bacterium]